MRSSCYEYTSKKKNFSSTTTIMAVTSIEMRPLVNRDSRNEDIDDTRMYMQDLPSRLARHATSTVIRSQTTATRKSRGSSIKRSSALKKAGKKHVVSPSQWNNETSEWPVSELSLPEEVIEAVDFKAVPLPMSVRRRYKDSLRARGPGELSKWKLFKLKATMGWSRFRVGLKESLYSLELWRGHLKDIEGQFGSGVVSYFVFLRWLMFLNLFVFLIEFGFVSLPTLVICARTREDYTPSNVSTCKYEFVYTSENTEGSFPTMVLDFITGQGWISNTIMFYSSYPSDAIISQEGVKYNLPLAYLLTGGAYLLLCLVIMIQNASSGLKEGYIDSEGVFNSFSNRLFSAWDYCICERNAAVHKKQIIVQDIRFELEEEERIRRAQNRTKKQKIILYGTRILINFFVVPALWYVSFVVIVGVIINKKVTEHGRNTFEQMLIR